MSKTDQDANDEYNEKVLATGVWINKEFLEEVLSNTLDSDVKVSHHEVSAAVGAGDNYLSILYKTAVRFTTKNSQEQEKHLMIKGVPTAKIMLDVIEEMGIFVKEIKTYNTILPAMQKLIKEYFPQNTPHVSPESYQCTRENTLIMEDLTESGYKMANRRDQLDYEHAAAVLRTLARFHALSLKIFEQDPDLVKDCGTEFYSEANREKMAVFLEQVFSVLANSMENWEDNRFAGYIRDMGECIWDKVLKMVEPSENLNVLNHGDMWVNNFLFKYNEDGSVNNAKLVDFQLLRYTTPAVDLHYFFFTSPQAGVLSQHMDDLIKIYHDSFTSTVSTLGLEINYPLEKLYEDMRDRSAYGLIALSQILPIVMAPPSEVFDLENVDMESMKSIKTDEEHPMMKNFKNAQYAKVAFRLLTHMESVGFLNDAKERMQPVVDAVNARKAAEQAGGVEE